MDTAFVWSCSIFAFKDVDTVHAMPRHRAKVDRLKESIRQCGILDPLVLETSGPRVKKWNVPYFLIDGHHRLRAATELGLKEVPVRFIEKWTYDMSKNFNGLTSPFDENVENGSPKTPSKKAEGKLKTNFEGDSKLASPFVDEITNPSHPGNFKE